MKKRKTPLPAGEHFPVKCPPLGESHQSGGRWQAVRPETRIASSPNSSVFGFLPQNTAGRRRVQTLAVSRVRKSEPGAAEAGEQQTSCI